MIIKCNLKSRSVDKPLFICIENCYYECIFFFYFYVHTHRVEDEFIYVRVYILSLRRLLIHLLKEGNAPLVND